MLKPASISTRISSVSTYAQLPAEPLPRMVRRTGTAYLSGRGKSGQCINWLNQGKGQGRSCGAQASWTSQFGAWERLKCEYSSRGSEVWIEAPVKRPSSVLVGCYPGGGTVLPASAGSTAAASWQGVTLEGARCYLPHLA